MYIISIHGFSLYNCNFFDDLYQKYNIERIYANLYTNSDTQNHGSITELIIRNYQQLFL